MKPGVPTTIPSLDGVRAIAVTLVFFAHSGLEHIVPGGLGVTIFFVLSGYLISTLLRIEYAADGGVNYRAFYLRRFLRLMPPLAVIVAIAIVLSGFNVVEEFTAHGFLAVMAYYGNYFVIANDFSGIPAGLGVVWSLAVEEHYYLLYPPLAAILLRVGRAGASLFTLSILCIAVLGWRCWLALQGVSAEYIGMATDTRIDAILIGCIMALWRNPWLDGHAARDQAGRKLALRDIALLTLSVGLLAFTLLYRDEFFRMTFRYALQSVAVAVLLYYAVACAKQRPFRWLNGKLLTHIGALSYTIYLAHHLVFQIIFSHWPQLRWLAATTLAVLFTWLIAESMHRWVEEPCAQLRKRLHKKPTVHEAHPMPHPAPGGTL